MNNENTPTKLILRHGEFISVSGCGECKYQNQILKQVQDDLRGHLKRVQDDGEHRLLKKLLAYHTERIHVFQYFDVAYKYFIMVNRRL